MRAKRLTVPERKDIFQALVTLQDMGTAVTDSIKQISEHYGVTEAAVRQIADEGLEREWPPLDEALVG